MAVTVKAYLKYGIINPVKSAVKTDPADHSELNKHFEIWRLFCCFEGAVRSEAEMSFQSNLVYRRTRSLKIEITYETR